nr:hypothetical protein Iba_chr01cCG9260 [Ipomoea batatas]
MSGGGVVGETKRGRGVCELMHERGGGLGESGKDWRMNSNALHGCVFSSDSAAIFLCCNGGWLFMDSIVDGGIKIRPLRTLDKHIFNTESPSDT